MDRRKQIEILDHISGHGVSYGQEFHTQPYPQKVVVALSDLETEVNNGGFHQYFINSSRETVHFVVEALKSIDAPSTADICERAIATAFPNGMPSDTELIRAVASSLDEHTKKKLDELSGEFFEYPHDLTDLLFKYVLKHPNSFGQFLSGG